MVSASSQLDLIWLLLPIIAIVFQWLMITAEWQPAAGTLSPGLESDMCGASA